MSGLQNQQESAVAPNEQVEVGGPTNPEPGQSTIVKQLIQQDRRQYHTEIYYLPEQSFGPSGIEGSKKGIEKLKKITRKQYHPKHDVDLSNFAISSEDFPEIYPEMFQVGFYQGMSIPNDNIYNPRSQGIKLTTSDRPVTINQLVSNIQNNNFVSVVGYPGSGKTTLSKRLARQLSANEDHLVLRKLFMDVNDCNVQMTLKDFLLGDCNYNLNEGKKNSVFEWITANPENCFIILDGFDQVSWNLRENLKKSNYGACLHYWELISNLCMGNFLQNCHLIFTSRPHAMLNIPQRCRPKLTCFMRDLTSENTKTLLDAFINNQQQSDVLWHELTKKTPHLKSICYNPLMLQLYLRACLSSHGIADISTMTRIFHTVLLNLKASGHVVSLSDDTVMKLSKIAYEATRKETVLITTEDLQIENLSIDKIHDLVVTLLGENRKCGLLEGQQILYFCHQTFQEYFTALYICRQMPLPDFELFVLRNVLNNHWSVVVQFLSGLLLDPYMNKGAIVQKKEIFTLALYENTREVVASQNGRFIITLSKILRESCDEEVTRMCGNCFDGGRILMDPTDTQDYFYAVTSFVKSMPARIESLDLEGCGMNSDGFLPWIEAINCMPGTIVRMYLPGNNLSTIDDVIKVLHKIEEELRMRNCLDDGHDWRRSPNMEELSRLQEALDRLENKKLKILVGFRNLNYIYVTHKDRVD